MKILLEAMDVEEDALNHFVALCGVNVVVQLEHPCWAKEWYFNQGGEKKHVTRGKSCPSVWERTLILGRGGGVLWAGASKGRVTLIFSRRRGGSGWK